MFVFFHAWAARRRRYFILLEAVDGESEVYLRVWRCAAGGLGWTREISVLIWSNLRCESV